MKLVKTAMLAGLALAVAGGAWAQDVKVDYDKAANGVEVLCSFFFMCFLMCFLICFLPGMSAISARPPGSPARPLGLHHPDRDLLEPLDRRRAQVRPASSGRCPGSVPTVYWVSVVVAQSL